MMTLVVALVAILSFWAGTALVWWKVESYWGDRPVPPLFRLYRAVDWFPAFLRLPPRGHHRLHVWLLRRYRLGGEE